MNQSDIVTSIGGTLTQLDTLLMSGNPSFDSAAWQQLFALRKHLDDQQRTLVQQAIQSNDEKFQAIAATLQAATKTLTTEIAQQAAINAIINMVSQVSANVDQLLKLA